MQREGQMASLTKSHWWCTLAIHEYKGEERLAILYIFQSTIATPMYFETKQTQQSWYTHPPPSYYPNEGDLKRSADSSTICYIFITRMVSVLMRKCHQAKMVGCVVISLVEVYSTDFSFRSFGLSIKHSWILQHNFYFGWLWIHARPIWSR